MSGKARQSPRLPTGWRWGTCYEDQFSTTKLLCAKLRDEDNEVYVVGHTIVITGCEAPAEVVAAVLRANGIKPC